MLNLTRRKQSMLLNGVADIVLPRTDGQWPKIQDETPK